jgi:photosystem II stability/assembly factor-like uncharacterized protein
MGDLISNAYGKNWRDVTPIPTYNTYSWLSVSISNTGQYQSAVSTQANNNIWISKDYGSTWYQVPSSSFNPPTNNLVNWSSISISSTGKIQVAVSSDSVNGNGTIYISNDYGNSWTETTTTFSNTSFVSVSMSNDGMYQSATSTYFDAGTGNSYSFIYRSTDYGNNWTAVYTPSQELLLNNISVSGDGKYQIAAVTADTLEFNQSGYILYNPVYGDINYWSLKITIGQGYQEQNFFSTAML